MDKNRLSDEVVPFQWRSVPERPEPILEVGNRFLGNGPIPAGVPLPSGQVLQPWFMVYGTMRTALQTYDNGKGTRAEWANRLDLFGNLNFSGTERLVVGIRPLDEDGKDFSGYNFRPRERDGWRNHTNVDLTTFFFEGDVGEIFPGLDPEDDETLDWGFSVGRQEIVLQDGLLVDDTIDLLGVTRNSLMPGGASNLRITGLAGWNDLHRGDNEKDRSSSMLGLDVATDIGSRTLMFDALLVDDSRDETGGYFLGIGAAERFGAYNTTFRAVHSSANDDSSEQVAGGTLLLAEVSSTLSASEDIVYANAFWGFDEFTSAARSPDAGGPLGRVGILFESADIGRFGSALASDARNSAGFALGWQHFMDGIRRQLIFEVAARDATDGRDVAEAAVGARYQQAIGQRHTFRLDGFIAAHEDRSPGKGARMEWLVKF